MSPLVSLLHTWSHRGREGSLSELTLWLLYIPKAGFCRLILMYAELIACSQQKGCFVRDPISDMGRKSKFREKYTSLCCPTTVRYRLSVVHIVVHPLAHMC